MKCSSWIPQRESEGAVSGPKGLVPWWVRGSRSGSPRDPGGQDPRGRLGGPPQRRSEEWTGTDADRPYVVILDEMNLARVEYYFSDFLSAMELSDGTISLRN